METLKSTGSGNSDASESSNSSTSVETQVAPVNVAQISQSDVLDLRVLFSEIARKWWLMLLFVAVGFYIGIKDMHNSGGSYSAKMIVAPVGSDAPARATGGAGLVNILAGMEIGGTKPITKFDRMVHTTKTQAFARMLDEKYQLMDRLYGAGFDKETNTWQRPKGFRAELREQVNTYLNLRVWMPPSIEDLASYIGGAFKVKQIEKSPFMEITFQHGNPDFALEMLLLVYREAESLVKLQDVEEVSKRKQFVEQRFSETRITEFKQALVDMMAEQARQEMMSHEDLPSVARIVEPAYVSKYKSVPNLLRSVGVPIFAAIGLAIGLIMLLVLVRDE
jgi:hypothetical protein